MTETWMNREQLQLAAGYDAGVATSLSNLGRLVLETARQMSDVSELFCYRVSDGERPERLLSAGRSPGCEERAAQYLQRFHHHDPAVRDLHHRRPQGGFVRLVRDVEILPYDYRELCYSGPQFVEKLSFGIHSAASWLVLSFYSANSFAKAERARLSPLATLALTTLVRQFPPLDPNQFVARMEQRIVDRFPELSARERQICARTISGLTADTIAQMLDITRGSVLTYRRRAYQKLGFSSSSDFLPFIVH